VLLSSVFGPYAQDDEYGSRVLNPMELYHNQVTRVQGPFSLRMFHRSWGLMLIQANIEAPCTLLDFPTLDRFVAELQAARYDIVGISSIHANILKVRRMCELVRQYQPWATLVVGGHIASIPDLGTRIDADQIVRGEGVRWFRQYLGEDRDRPLRHPLIKSGLGTRSVGVAVRDKPGDVAATVIPSVGCPLGCNFCATSALFGGKGKFANLYETGDELFDIMSQLEAQMQVRSFFMMDENFLLHRLRALRLLELMQQQNKSWSLYVFSSANVLRSYSLEQLVALGISWVWMGLEGEESQYLKLRGIDTRQLVRQLQSHGIRVLGSTIIGLENHTRDNIDRVITYAVEHATDFHQFMLYTPIAGTPLYAQLTAEGRMKDAAEYHPADIHGQYIFNYRHPHLCQGEESELILRAFQRDFELNGPSVARIAGTTLAGWRRYGRHADPRIRDRFRWEARELATTYSAIVAASAAYFRRTNPAVFQRLRALQRELATTYGLKSRLASWFGGRFLLARARREERRLAAGWTCEPPTFYERNFELEGASAAQASAMPCRYVTPAEVFSQAPAGRPRGTSQSSPPPRRRRLAP